MRTIALTLLYLPLLAADITVSDFRLEAGAGTVTNYDAEYRYKAGPISGVGSGTYKADSYDGDGPLFLSAMYTHANLDPVGFLWAAGVEWQNDTEDVSGESFDTNLIGAKVRLGIGWAPIERLRLEATAEGQFGYISAEDGDVDNLGGFERETATGTYQCIGVQVSAGYVFHDHWEVGASARALAFSASTEADFDNTGGSYEADLSWTYLSIAATVAYRF